MEEEKGQRAISQETLSDKDRKNLLAEEDVNQTRAAAKEANRIRDNKFYEIPTEFPYLMHGSGISHIESILSHGLVPRAGQVKEDLAERYVDKKVVCAVAPKKIKSDFHDDFIAFPGSAYDHSLEPQFRLTFKMPPGEKVYMEDISSDHPRECRIDRKIEPGDIHSIQAASSDYRRDGSLWGFFTQDPFIYRGCVGNDVEKSINLTVQWPEHSVTRADLEAIIRFLGQYDIQEEDKIKLSDLIHEFTAISEECREICNERWDSARSHNSRESGRNISSDSDIEIWSRSFEYYKRKAPELNKRALAIINEFKNTFQDIIQHKIGINPLDKISFNSYFNYLREKYHLSKEEYSVLYQHTSTFDS